MKLVVVIDGSPVPKARPRFTGRHAFTAPRTREYERMVKDALTAACAQIDWPRDREYKVRIAVYRAARRGDLDNYIKACTDAGNGVIYEDDKQIVEMHGMLFVDKVNPRVLIEVEAA